MLYLTWPDKISITKQKSESLYKRVVVLLKTYRPFALRGHVTSFLKKTISGFQKRLVGHILNKVIVIWFFKPVSFS